MQDDKKFNQITDHGKILDKMLNTGELEQFRNEDIGQALVDVVKRDQENGTFNINIIVYHRPDLRKNQVEPAIKVACIHLFGGDKSDIDLFYRDEFAIARDIGSNVPFQNTNSWCIEILWPRSIYYSNLSSVKNAFMNTLSLAVGK